MLSNGCYPPPYESQCPELEEVDELAYDGLYWMIYDGALTYEPIVCDCA